MEETLCIRCKQPHASHGFKVCIECREKQEYNSEHRLREVRTHTVKQFTSVMKRAVADGIIKKEEGY